MSDHRSPARRRRSPGLTASGRSRVKDFIMKLPIAGRLGDRVGEALDTIPYAAYCFRDSNFGI